MVKKLISVLIVVLCFTVAFGCGSKKVENTSEPKKQVEVPTGPGPTSTDPKATAEMILKFKQAKDWSTLYDYIYVDIQKTISREDFVAYNSKAKVTYENHKVAEQPKVLPEWIDKINNITYKNVAEVSYTADIVTPRGKVNFTNKMYLVQTPEKNWRYLWIKK